MVDREITERETRRRMVEQRRKQMDAQRAQQKKDRNAQQQKRDEAEKAALTKQLTEATTAEEEKTFIDQTTS